MKLVVVGDYEGNWKPIQEIFDKEFEADTVGICIGTFKEIPEYAKKGRELVFLNSIKTTECPHAQSDDSFLQAGQVYTLRDGTRIAGLPGVHPKSYQSDRFRTFTPEEGENTKSLTSIDVLLTETIPLGVSIGTKGARGLTVRNLIEHMEPKMAIYGNDYIINRTTIGDTYVAGGLLFPTKYFCIDSSDFSLDVRSTRTDTDKISDVKNYIGALSSFFEYPAIQHFFASEIKDAKNRFSFLEGKNKFERTLLEQETIKGLQACLGSLDGSEDVLSLPKLMRQGLTDRFNNTKLQTFYADGDLTEWISSISDWYFLHMVDIFS